MSAAARRNRIPLAVASVCAVVVLVAGFPLVSLIRQHQQLAAASAQLHQIRAENQRLAQQQQALNSKTEINRLARQNYQLVSPGQILYDVLPPSGTGATTSTFAGDSQSGDPGLQPLVTPSDAPDMSPDPGLPHAPPVGSSSTGTDAGDSSSSSAASGAPKGASSFWGRVANTLEFWQ